MSLIALALFLRILIPSGWMPAADRLGLVPCLGTARAVPMAHIGMAHHATSRHAPHNEGDKSDKPCAFAALACSLAEPSGPSVARVMPTVAPMVLAASAAAAPIGAGLAAPPPPPTGPPTTT